MTTEFGIVKRGEIKALRTLEKDEYEEHEKSIEYLLRFSQNQQLFTILKMNYIDFENLLHRYGDEYSKDRTMSWSQIETMLTNINRHILNFLSSMRTFLDHSETDLKRLHEHDSSAVKNFQKACSDAYDNQFSYRFLSKLRNYAQHCGMPIGELKLHSSLVKGTDRTVDSLTINFSRDKLLANFDWGSQLKKELQALPTNFEIAQHLNNTMACLEEINKVIIKDIPNLQYSANKLQKLVEETAGTGGAPCFLNFEKLDPDGNKLNVQIGWLPVRLIEAFRSK